MAGPSSVPQSASEIDAHAIVLETERLRLRRMSEAHAGFLLELLNEPAFIENVADRGVRTLAQAKEFIAERILASYQKYGFGFYVVELKEGRIPAGICGLVKRETLDDVDIGYALLARHCGKGYAYEAAAALLDYGRTTLKLPKIVAVTTPGNQSSIKLLEKLGLKFEKVIHLPGYGAESLLFT